MNLKSAVFTMRETIMNQQVDELVEDFIHDLEVKNELKPGTLVFYFDHLTLQKNRSAQVNTSNDSKKVNRKWTKFEIEFMFQYIKERQEEGALNITEILEEVAQLLNRGYQSVNYKYYNLIKIKEKKEQQNQNGGYQFTTIAEDEVPVLSTELIQDYALTPSTKPLNASSDVDLLDILSGLITNIQQLPGIQLNELLRSLYQLTNMALQNQDVVQQLEDVKAETFHEKEALQEKLKKKEQQLIAEKRRNDELQEEVDEAGQGDYRL